MVAELATEGFQLVVKIYFINVDLTEIKYNQRVL